MFPATHDVDNYASDCDHDYDPLLANTNTSDKKIVKKNNMIKSGSRNRNNRLPCIIRDVEKELTEAEQAQSYVYPPKRRSQTFANRIL